MCCARLAGDAGPKNEPKFAIWALSPQLFRAIFSQLRHVSTIRDVEKSLDVKKEIAHSDSGRQQIGENWGLPLKCIT